MNTRGTETRQEKKGLFVESGGGRRRPACFQSEGVNCEGFSKEGSCTTSIETAGWYATTSFFRKGFVRHVGGPCVAAQPPAVGPFRTAHLIEANIRSGLGPLEARPTETVTNAASWREADLTRGCQRAG